MKVFGDLHEDGDDDNDSESMSMDLANNKTGRETALKEGKEKDKDGKEKGEEGVKAACERKARGGELVTICGGKNQRAC